MTVKELITTLEKADENAVVIIKDRADDTYAVSDVLFTTSLINGTPSVVEIDFSN
jgi:hypothetical protein